MNARGSTEVIVASIGLSMGVLSQRPLHDDRHHGGGHHDGHAAHACAGRSAGSRSGEEERERLEREAFEAKGFVPNLERLLLAVDDSPKGASPRASPACSPARAACR